MNSSPLTPQSLVQQSGNQVSCELDGEALLMHLESGAYFGCGEVGSRIWSLLAQPKRVEEVCRILQEEFDVDPERCEREATSFLTDLLSEGLITLGPRQE